MSGSFDKEGKQSGFFSRDGETLYEAVAKSGYLPEDNEDNEDIEHVKSPSEKQCDFLDSNDEFKK